MGDKKDAGFFIKAGRLQIKMVRSKDVIMLTEEERRTGILKDARIFGEAFIEIPEGIREIAAEPFSGNAHMAGLSLPRSLRRIRAGAFARCVNLRFVLGGENIECIEDGAFAFCSHLQQLPEMKKLQHLGNRAFEGCRELKEIHLPESLETMGSVPFLGCRTREFSVPKKFRQTAGRLGLPDSAGFLLKGNKLLEYMGTQTEIHVPDNVREICAGAFDGLHPAKDRQIIIHFPEKLRRLEYSEVFRSSDVRLPERFLRQPILLSTALTHLLETGWQSQAAPMDYVCLFLFQRGALRKLAGRYLDNKENPIPCEEAGRLILERLAENDMTEKQFSRAFTQAVQWYFLHAGDMGPGFAVRLGRLAGLAVSEPYPEIFADRILAAHKAAVTHPVFAKLDKERPGTSVRAKRALALYLALGEHCELLDENALPFLIPAAEHEAEYVSRGEWDIILEEVLPAGPGTSRTHLYPLFRFASRSSRVKLMAQDLPNCLDEPGKLKPVYLSDSDAVLSAMVHSSVSDDSVLRNYFQILAPLGTAHRICFPSSYEISAEGERTFCLPDGSPWVTLFYRKGEFHLRNDATGRECRQLPVFGTGMHMVRSSQEIYKICDYLTDIRAWVKQDRERSFLLGTSLEAGAWERIYRDDYLKDLGTGILWEQAGRLFVWDGRFARGATGRRRRLGTAPVRAAHPFEMTPEERRTWSEVLSDRYPATDFCQFGEPLYGPEEIDAGRFAGCQIPASRLHQLPYALPEHIRTRGWDFDLVLGAGTVLKGAVHDPLSYTRIELGRLCVEKLDRTANHMLYLFDLWTVEERVARDDITVLKIFPYLDAPMQEKMLKHAMQHQAVRITAAFLEILRTRTASSDEFTLDD